jgi:hypothetical protein
MRNRLLFFTLLTLSTAASAQNSGRAGTWEAGFDIFDTSSISLNGEGGSGLKVDGDLGFGGVLNYNVTDKFAIGGELNWSSPDYRATLVPDNGGPTTVKTTLDVLTLQLKGTYYFSASKVSPFLEAGAGWTRVDSNIADGPPSTGCWWDPWWGYVCTSFYDTYAETRISYSAALGVRWDLGRDALLKASYGVFDFDMPSGTDNLSKDVLRLDYLWKF